MADRFTYDVFLSHNSKDKPRVRALAEKLRAAGLRVATEHGLDEARAQVLCLSPAALGSEWVALERSTVLFRDPKNVGRRFIPLLLADCELPDALRRYKYVDYRRETKAAFAELRAACRSEPESAPPAQPPEQAEPLAVVERKLIGHTNWVRSVAVSPDGTWAASGSDDKTVKIWDLETGKCRTTLKGHTQGVNSVCDHTGWEADSVGGGRRVRSRLGRKLGPGIGEPGWAHECGLVGGRVEGQRSRSFRGIRQDAQAVESCCGYVSEDYRVRAG
ncbi:MAG TPA: TIR domain-containing protein [Thermoanaerobaculia bacterium]|nr:TIR domain-containing protein [Thermoanaerobaculia bacterium]